MQDNTDKSVDARGRSASPPKTAVEARTDEYGIPLEPPDANSFEYDEELAPGFFIQIRSDFLRSPNYSAYAKVAYCILLTWAGAGYNAWPGQERLATEVGVSVRTLRDVIEEMKTKGLLTVKRRGLGKTNVYRVHKLPVMKPTIPENPDRQNLPIKNDTNPDRQNLPIKSGSKSRSESALLAGELHAVVLDSEELDSTHTDTQSENKEGADALCVLEKDTYPKSNKEAISNTGVRPNQRTRKPQDNATDGRTTDSTSDRISRPKPAKPPVDGLQSEIEARLKTMRIATTKARELATQLVAVGRGIDYVERWIVASDQEKISNRAAYLIQVLSLNADPPETQADRRVTSWQKYDGTIFNRQPDQERPSA